MKRSNLLRTVVVVLLFAFGVLAQPSQTQRLNGRIIEQAPFVLPAYEQLRDDFKRTYSKQTVEAIRNSRDLELLKIKYMSGGLKIVGRDRCAQENRGAVGLRWLAESGRRAKLKP